MKLHSMISTTASTSRCAADHPISSSESRSAGQQRGDPRARGLLPLGGLVFAMDQAIPLHEDRYGLVERFVKDHRAALLTSSSSDRHY